MTKPFKTSWVKQVLALFITLMLGSSAHAHKPSDSYLQLRIEGSRVVGQWDIALRDLEFAIGLDSDGDGQIRWGELKRKHDAIAAYALSRLEIGTRGQACRLRPLEHLVDRHSDGAYEVLRFEADCPSAPRELQIKYALFFDLDPQHKGLLRMEQAGQTRSAIFSNSARVQEVRIGNGSFSVFLDYAVEGIWHIWIGFDHILFLMALLLPAVLTWMGKAWQPLPRFWPAFVNVAKIVTAFTVAHSITLTLATLKVVELPSRLVESVIALSVLLAALNNLKPLLAERRWAMAFVFGLIHGFGFAAVLSELGLPPSALALSLVGFNLGVEAGQLAIVAAFLPIAWWLRCTRLYRWGVLGVGSVLIALMSLIWLAERALDLKLL